MTFLTAEANSFSVSVSRGIFSAVHLVERRFDE